MMKACSTVFALLLLALPYVAVADSNPRIICIGNLKQLDGAVYGWAQDNHLSDTNSYSLSDDAILRYLPKSNMVVCPAGGTYVAAKTVADAPRCTFHGSIEDMQQDYMMARHRHNGMQIGMGIVSFVLACLLLRGLKYAQGSGRISETVQQILSPSLLLLSGLLVSMMPQDSLRPTFGITRPILNVPAAVFFFYGLIVSIRTMFSGRKIPLVFLCVFSGVFVLLLSLIIISWWTILRR